MRDHIDDFLSFIFYTGLGTIAFAIVATVLRLVLFDNPIEYCYIQLNDRSKMYVLVGKQDVGSTIIAEGTFDEMFSRAKALDCPLNKQQD